MWHLINAFGFVFKTGCDKPAGGSHSPAPTVEELFAQLSRQPPVAEGSTEPAAAIAEEAVATEAQEEAPAEAGLVDIAASSAPQP
jgi:hypothetical protein